MTIDKSGIDLIQKFEGCKLKPYLCSTGIPTIGWGNTYYKTGKKVTLKDNPITQAEADDLFTFLMPSYEKQVTNLVKTKLTQNQFNALVSFAYNVGVGSLANSTLLKKVNANPNDPTIKTEFAKWNKSNGRPIQGLINRRAAEGEMYFS